MGTFRDERFSWSSSTYEGKARWCLASFVPSLFSRLRVRAQVSHENCRISVWLHLKKTNRNLYVCCAAYEQNSTKQTQPRKSSSNTLYLHECT
jgi:hypothetical protein